MAAIEPIDIVELDVDDAPAGLVLSTEAGWNQNEADWRFFLSNGVVFGVRHDTRLVASAALLPYSAGNAWISMVLVTSDFRRRGIATKLVDACLGAAARRGLTAWLDATPAGATVYGPLGFTPTLQLRRLRLEKPQGATATRLLAAGRIDALATRDSSAMGFDRSTLLSEFSARPGSRIVSDDRAMALVRDGRAARQIGPLLADRTEQALALVDAIVGSETGPWLIDAVHSQEAFLQELVQSGWNIERPFQRMRFGRPTAPPAQLPFAVAGPEFG
ncbi:GNAT family N-acetyltransferase [Bradyrhizobium sp. CCBAU 051011]|uniref:GNAT family N-acetyltransferase n=1 Tax=Bradyrhizobium sp. CCBAU 051011 TaxID=858422 RepID=UPI001373FB10|nr:GNAT family N-acetyltransferase [Bradyrhizobium sp. CCBAU 051011]QHO74897.1 GNAT family N-acetyltransferase [Bradyrhizobium sp. CCBAU 051011]